MVFRVLSTMDTYARHPHYPLSNDILSGEIEYEQHSPPPNIHHITAAASGASSATDQNNSITNTISHMNPNTNPNNPPTVSNAPILEEDRGVSCHQCKSNKPKHLLLFCTTQVEPGRKRKCRKKYCQPPNTIMISNLIPSHRLYIHNNNTYHR